jgi:hypothetical protein
MGLLAQTANAQSVSSKPLNIAVIIKATDSDYRQYMAVGAENYAKEHPNVRVTIYGPQSETDVAQQLAILEKRDSEETRRDFDCLNQFRCAGSGCSEGHARGYPGSDGG